MPALACRTTKPVLDAKRKPAENQRVLIFWSGERGIRYVNFSSCK